MLVTKIKIQNFKAIRNLSLDLKPLTVIVGPNGSGKTSVLEAITLFAQSSGREITRRDKNDIVNFGEDNDMFYNRDTNNELSLGFETKLEDEEAKDILMYCSDARDKQINKLKEIQKPINFKNQLDMDTHNTRIQTINEFIKILDNLRSELVKRKIGYSYGIRIEGGVNYVHHSLSVGNFSIENETPLFKVDYADLSTFLPGRVRYSSPKDYIELDKLLEILKRKMGDISTKRKIFSISSTRGWVPWEYTAIGAKDVGFNGEHTIEIISKILGSRDFTRISDLDFFAALFGIQKIWTGWIRTGDKLSSSYIDPITGASPLKFPHLGYGSKQILPIIVQLVENESETLTLIEEPEISMHPQYQIQLPFLLAHAVNKGQQLIVTTQSSYFPLALGKAIQGETLTPEDYGVPEKRKIKLNREDIAVYQMTRDEKGVKAELLEFEEDGFLKRGVPTFVEVEKKLFRRIFS